MLKHGRSSIAAFTACAILLCITAPAYPSYNSEAGHMYSVASQRLANLKKSSKKIKYRSYWMDCIQTFEQVEKKFPESPRAADACFDRAGVYLDLYRHNKYSKDLDEALQVFGKCQTAYPKHAKASEALYHVIDLSLNNKKDAASALNTYTKLSEAYPKSSWTKKAKARFGPALREKRKPELEIKKMPVPVLTSVGAAKAEGVVKTIRHWSEGAYTRIVIDQSGPVHFQVQELKNPDRLVFDLSNARVDNSLNKEPLPINDGILKQVRASQYAPDIVRVVLDLASIKSYVAFPLREPDRLVIDVTGENGRAGENPVVSAGTETKGDSAGVRQTAKPEDKTEPKDEKKSEVPQLFAQKPETQDNGGERLTLSRQMGLKVKTIAIDAGHGGHDPGAIGKGGLKEKTVTLDIAKRLAVLVKGRLGCKVVMTRDKDVFVPLDKRPFIAKARSADLFVSIHVNANRKRKAKGIETYIQGLKASDREAMATAARENAMSTKSLSELDSDVDRMLKDLKIDNKLEESLQLAWTVQTSLVDSMATPRKKVVNLGVKRAFFYVLMNTNIPSILAEVGFITNAEEEKLLNKDSYRQAIAEALYQGVKKYVDARSPQMMGI